MLATPDRKSLVGDYYDDFYSYGHILERYAKDPECISTTYPSPSQTWSIFKPRHVYRHQPAEGG
jgi:hypothetical protein